MPHFVYSQSGFFVYSQAAFAALEQIRNASSNIDLKSAFSSEGAQQESTSTIPRSFILMWPSSRNARLGKNSSPNLRKTKRHVRRNVLRLARQGTPPNKLR